MKKAKFLFIGYDKINGRIEVNSFVDFEAAEDEADNFEQHLMSAIIIPFSKTKELIYQANKSIKQNRK